MSKYAQVLKQQKAIPYTVSVIGDTQALEFWKKAQAQKEYVRQITLEPIRGATRGRAMEMVSDQSVNPYKHRPEDKQELQYRAKRLAQAKSDLKTVNSAFEAHQAPPLASDTSEAPKSLLSRIIASLLG
jgi:hypothetical protein